ncbi:membrane lipoprotein lipid attachment site-containing protein [Marinobacter fonticola]|uniref:membrane lipoprotein lipid attachment site-containing protein n=1 Tax=Marinobacter fonticola TaxID=2603215 RepID=UPI0011E6B6F8|nr:membrane lipoprotein lipid attachment site-containing protein [Marinobacter fonticola]
MRKLILIALAGVVLAGCSKDRVLWEDNGKVEEKTENREVWDDNGKVDSEKREFWDSNGKMDSGERKFWNDSEGNPVIK